MLQAAAVGGGLDEEVRGAVLDPLNEAALAGVDQRFGPVLCLELFVDPFDMRMDRMGTDVQVRGDFFIGHAQLDTFEDALLALA
jgi:hypothetical protein